MVQISNYLEIGIWLLGFVCILVSCFLVIYGSNMWSRKLVGGLTIKESKLEPPRGIRSARRNIIPYRSRLYHSLAFSDERIPPTTLNPSRGAIGRKFISPRNILIFTTSARNKTPIVTKLLCSMFINSLISTAHSIAKIKLDAGPANAISAESRLGSRKLNGSIGTGLAQPNSMPILERYNIRGRRIDPNGSMWGRGFNVSLPAKRAVGSPRRSATNP